MNEWVGSIIITNDFHNYIHILQYKGGGFSTYFPTPKWQKSAVANYFNVVNTLPSSGYNPNGRAYPDISFIGVDYQVYILGSIVSLYGTSASAPVFGAMISLINAKRFANGESSLGFLNPTLYSYSYNGSNYQNISNTFNGLNPFTDITSGNNACTVNGVNCCNSGFETAVDWDPVTGMGSIVFGKYYYYYYYCSISPYCYCKETSLT